MENKAKIFIACIIGALVIVVGLGMTINKPTVSKYTGLAQALKIGGAQFFGAFWCPHCQAQKAAFGSAVKELPYIECSNADKSQTPVCKENRIESYPTWKFKDGISLISKEDPIVCSIRPGAAGEPEICANSGSAYFKTWIFPGNTFAIQSPTDPVREGDVWKFSNIDARTTGEIPMEFLAQQINYALPQ